MSADSFILITYANYQHKKVKQYFKSELTEK